MKKYLLKNWWRYLIGGLSLIGSTGLDVLVPIITMKIIDEVIVGRNMDMLPVRLLQLAAFAVGRAAFQYIKEYLCDMAGCNVAEDMRKDLMKHITGLSKSFFDKSNTGELMARVKDDGGKIWDLFGFVGMLLTEAVLYFIGVVICMIRLNWKLALIPLAYIPFLAWGVMKLEKKLDKSYGEISEENALLTRIIEENISGVRTVKAFSAEKDEIAKFDERNSKYNQLNIEQAYDMAKAEPLLGAIPKIMQLTVLIIGGIAVINGHISYGVLAAFIQYAANIVWPIENMGWMLSLCSAGVAGRKKVLKVFAQKPEIVEKDDAYIIDNMQGNLSFDNVTLSLGEHNVLEDISFDLPKGHTLGIMGATGSGKTMIVNLIGRFYDTTKGNVLIDGVNIKDMSLSQVRSFSSVVTQDVFLFSDTIRENVKLGSKKTMSENRVHKAIARAQAKSFVEKINGSYEAVIGERGIGLSGGQKQRLSIARAMAKDASLLILDDSTSALDTETEADIQKELSKEKNMSKIIIAHRISSVKDADEIIVLENGKVAERGTHETLMNKKGMYYATYEAQYGNYHDAMKAMEGGVS